MGVIVGKFSFADFIYYKVRGCLVRLGVRRSGFTNLWQYLISS